MKLKMFVGLVILLILGFTVFGDHGLLNLARNRRQLQALKMEASRLEKENEKLREEIWRLNNDADYIEQLAREELGMVKPGELVIKFSGADDSAGHDD